MAMDKPVRMDDDTPDCGVPLRERYERFCGHFVESRNRMQAFRLAFVVDKKATSQWVHEQSAKLMRDPAIMARVQDMRDAAAAQTIVTVRDIIQDLHDIATADPNELVSVVRDACRFCHGVGHHHQWIDEAEYAGTCDDAMKRTKPGCDVVMPDMSGGFGFTPTAEPNPMCPACFGRGVEVQMQRDTTRLSPQARKLYAGISKGEIQIHDQVKAREMLGRVLGAFKDGIPVTPTQPITQPITPEMKEHDAGRAYLQLVGGGR